MSRAHRLLTASLLTVALIFTGLVAFTNYAITRAESSSSSDTSDSPTGMLGVDPGSPNSQDRQESLVSLELEDSARVMA